MLASSHAGGTRPWAAVGGPAVVWVRVLPVACNEYGCVSGRIESVGSP